jgi:hypothetical protein
VEATPMGAGTLLDTRAPARDKKVITSWAQR